MRGLSMAYNASRGFLSGRGYANSGSHSGRLTLLIDGYRATDGFFGRTYFGTDGLLDVALIERVEYIPGNGSSSYGDSAFLGVVNIVTKKGKDIDGRRCSIVSTMPIRTVSLPFSRSVMNCLLTPAVSAKSSMRMPARLRSVRIATPAD